MAVLLVILLLFGFVLGGFGGSSSSSSGSGSTRINPVVKCSKRMTTDQQHGFKCGPPPANP